MLSTSLHARFRTAMLSIAAVLAVVVGVVVYVSARANYLETGEASARASIAAVQQTLAVGVYAHDDVLLKELLVGLVRHPSVSRVAVRDAGGVMLATESAPEQAGQAAQSPMPGAETPPSFSSTLMSPFSPEETMGRLDVWLGSARLASEARHQAAMVVGLLTVLLAGMLLVFNSVASRLLSRPMHRLAGQLAALQPGTMRRLTIDAQHEHDEVGIVTAAANRLLELQQRALERERTMREELAALEARYRGIFDSTSAGIFILSPGGVLLQSNPALSRLLGMPPGPMEAGHVADFVAAAFLRPAQLAHLIERARMSLQPEAMDVELVRRDGSNLWAHCMVSCSVEGSSERFRVEGVLYDITQRKLQEHAARHRAEHDALTGLKSRAYIESSLGQHVNGANGANGANGSDGAVTLMFIDLDGFKAVNDRWGHAAGDAVLVEVANRLRLLFQRNCDVVGRLGGDELVVMIIGVEASHPGVAELAARLIETFHRPFAMPNGEAASVGASVGVASYPLHAGSSKALIDAADAAMYAVKQSGKGGFAIAEKQGDWTDGESEEWKEAFSALVATSNTQRDPLTGLMDRRQLVDQLASEHARVQGGADSVGVICLDIDQFKILNVAHGTHIGDEVLCEVARRLGGMLRRSDTVARTGSDEFVALVPSESGSNEEARQTAEGVARKLLASLATPFKLSSCTITIHASAGVSFIDGDTVEGLDALREAQLALRRSKSLGGSTTTFFEQDMMAGVHDRLTLEDDLRAAMGTDQFCLNVQPQVDREGTVTGGEALLRWSHPVRGSVPPDQFIPLAESSGVIVELGVWVLRTGCEVLKRMRQGGGRQTLAVNISPIQFNHPDFVREVRAALEASGAPADGLILEITEGLLITDVNRVSERLHELVALGVRFSIDDFGTGFSSLAYLRQLPLHEIKIDRSFIASLPGDVASAGIVGSILSMGSHLGLHVVAEGVETAEQAAFLVERGCPTQQGWLYGRPMLPEKFLGVAGAVTELAGDASTVG